MPRKLNLFRFILITFISSFCLAVLPEYVVTSLNALPIILYSAAFFTAGFSSLFILIVISKRHRVGHILTQAENKDPLWHENNLKLCARGAFYKVQAAFESGDVSSLQRITTPEYCNILIKDIRKAVDTWSGFCIESIDIEETDIVSLRDYHDNNLDKFVAYIKGTVSGHDKSHHDSLVSNSFSEMYHFVRHQEDWLLYKITGKAKIVDLLLTRSFAEK